MLYGDAALKPAAAALPGCETLDVCGTSKFDYVPHPGGAVGAVGSQPEPGNPPVRHLIDFAVTRCDRFMLLRNISRRVTATVAVRALLARLATSDKS